MTVWSLAISLLARHARRVREAEHAFGVLFELTRAMTEQDLELDAALESVTNAARELFEGEHASLRILDDSGDLLLSAARSGEGTNRSPVPFRRGEGVIGWVIEHGKVARIDDAPSDPRFVHIGEQGYTIQSMLALPLWSAGKVIGCLCVTSHKHGHFTQHDEIVGRLLANCAVPQLERARLEHLATTDGLTGALNQAQLVRVLDRAIDDARSRETPLSVLSMDLDHFKRVNDEHGHATGDEVLRVFAQRVRGVIRGEDVFIRRGGEEFVVVLPRCDLDSAAQAAERVREHMKAPIHVADVEIAQRVSVGVALWDGSESAAQLDERADNALYAAKKAGRDRVSIAPTS